MERKIDQTTQPPAGAEVIGENTSQSGGWTTASHLKAHHKGFSLDPCVCLWGFWEHFVILRHVQVAKHSGLIIIIIYTLCRLPSIMFVFNFTKKGKFY